MDPLSIVGTVVGLTATCLQTVKALHHLKDKFEHAGITIVAICTETTIISTSLSRIQSSILSDADAMGKKIQDGNLDLTIDAALTGCYVVFDVLRSEIEKIIDPEDSNPTAPLSFRSKTKVVWNESMMRELLGQLRGQQTALTLLLQLLATDTISELKQMMDTNVAVLSQVVERTRRFRSSKQSRAPESIFDISFTTLSIHGGDGSSILSSTAFRFDEEIVNSQVYRRTLAKAYAAVKDQAEKETTASTSGEAHQDPGDDDAASSTAASSSAPALASETNANVVQDASHASEVVKKILIAEESIDKVLDETSLYHGKIEEWVTQWKIRRSDIEDVPRKLVERQFIIHELIYSEHLFLKQLLLLRCLYKHCFMLSWLGTPNSDEMRSSKLKWPGLEEIFELNKKYLYEPLLSRQASQGPWILSIADIFETWLPLSAPAYQNFAREYAGFRQFVTLQARKNGSFSQYLEKSRALRISEELVWSHYLSAPLARLQRYTLLLRVLLTKGDLENPQHECDRMRKVIQDLQRSLRECNDIISEKSISPEVQHIKSSLASKYNRTPKDSRLPFSQEMVFRRRTLESSNTVDFVIHDSNAGD